MIKNKVNFCDYLSMCIHMYISESELIVPLITEIVAETIEVNNRLIYVSNSILPTLKVLSLRYTDNISLLYLLLFILLIIFCTM